MHSLFTDFRLRLLEDGIFLILLILADQAGVESFVTFHFPFPFCIILAFAAQYFFRENSLDRSLAAFLQQVVEQ